MLVRLPDGKGAPAVRKALAKRIVTLPTELRRSITWEQGKELAEHVRFTVDTGVQIYFCDPKSPWQEPLATRIEREHQRPSASVLPQGHRTLGLHPGTAQRRRTGTQRSPSTNPRMSVTIRDLRRGCCVDGLSPV